MQTVEQAKKASDNQGKAKSNSSRPPILFGDPANDTEIGGTTPTKHYVLYLACTADGILLPLDEHGKISVLNPCISTEVKHHAKNARILMDDELMRLARDTPFSLEIYPGQRLTPVNEMCTDLDEHGRASKVFHTLIVHGKTEHRGDFVVVPYAKLMLDPRIVDGATLQVFRDLIEMESLFDQERSSVATRMEEIHNEMATLADERETFIVATCREGILLGSIRSEAGIIWTLRNRHLHQCMPGVTEAVAERLLRKMGGYKDKTRTFIGTFVIDNRFVDIYTAELKATSNPFSLELRIFTRHEVIDMMDDNGSNRFDEITKKILAKI